MSNVCVLITCMYLHLIVLPLVIMSILMRNSLSIYATNCKGGIHQNCPRMQKPSISNTQREVLRRIPRGQDETREDNDWENNNGNNHTLVPGGLHPLVPQQTVHDPESDVPKPVNDPRHGTQHDWDENHCENSECTFPRGHPGMCSHHLVGNDADGPPANRLRKRTHQAHFIDSTTLPSTHGDDMLDGVFDICFTGDSDSSNDSSNKRIFSVHLAESKGIPIPRTYEEAMASKYWKEWKAAMDKEIQSLLAHNTWKEIDSLPAGRKATKSRWVYTIKYNRDMVLSIDLRHVLSFAVTRNRLELIMIARFLRRCEHPVSVHYLALHQP